MKLSPLVQKIIVKYFFISILFFNIFAMGEQVINNSRELSLKDLVEYAILNSPSLKSSVNNLYISELNKENSSVKFLPSLDVNTRQGLMGGDPQEPIEDSYSNFELSLGSRIYDNGRNLINYDRSKLQYYKSRVELEKNKAELSLKIAKEYYNYLLAQKVLEIQKKQHQLLQKQFKSIKNLYRQGLKKRIDFVRFQARLQRAKLSKKQAEIRISKSLEEIKRIVSWSVGELKIAGNSEKEIDLRSIPIDIPNIKNHYLSKIVDYEKGINSLLVKEEKRNYWPEVYLDASAAYNKNNYLRELDSLSDNPQLDWSAELTVRFNLWDWGQRRKKVSIAELKSENLNNTISEKLLLLRANLNTLMLDIVQEKENYLLNKELMNLELKNYSAIRRNYRAGQTSFLDLINSLDNYTGAQESYYRNYYQLKKSISDYYYHEGSIYEKINSN